jgi:hypothetical protein
MCWILDGYRVLPQKKSAPIKSDSDSEGTLLRHFMQDIFGFLPGKSKIFEFTQHYVRGQQREMCSIQSQSSCFQRKKS